MPARLQLPDDHPHVALVTIDRPEQANSLDPEMSVNRTVARTVFGTGSLSMPEAKASTSRVMAAKARKPWPSSYIGR